MTAHSRHSEHVWSSSNQAEFPSKSASLWRCRLLRLSTALAICSLTCHILPELRENSLLLTCIFQSSNSKRSAAECCGLCVQALCLPPVLLVWLLDKTPRSHVSRLMPHTAHTQHPSYLGYLLLAFFSPCSPDITLPPADAFGASSPR